MSVNRGIVGLRGSISALALINFFGETDFGFLEGIALLLYGSYLVGNNEFDR